MARWGTVAVFALASTWNYLDRLVLSAAAPRIRAEFHLSNTDFGWVVSAFSLAYAAASPAVGWFLDWMGLDAGIACAVAAWSIGAALCAVTRGFGQLLGARAFLGAWESAGVPAAGKLNAMYLEPKNRALGAAFTQVGLSIGGVAAPLLVNAFAGWRTSFFVCSALGLLWIPIWLFVRRAVPPFEKAVTGPVSLRIFKDPRLITLAAATVLWMVAYSLWSNWTTLYLTQTYGMSTKQANDYAWFPPVASTLGAFAGGWMSRRRIARGSGAAQARISAMALCAIGCTVTVFAPVCPTPFWGTLVIAASYFWTTAGSVNLYTLPVDLWGSARAGTAISALVLAYGILQTGFSPLIGTLADRFGFAPVCWLVALPPLGAWLLLRRSGIGVTAPSL